MPVTNETLPYPTDGGANQQTINDLVDQINTLVGTICAKKAALNVIFATFGVPYQFDMSGC